MITATASDSDGTIAKVEFFQGATKLGEDASSPYAFTWENVAAGNYSLTAVATDDKGANTTSSAVDIIINSQPTEYDAPYDIPRFQAFMAGCKLQAPTSSTVATSSDLINGYSSDNFYVADGDKVAFNQTGTSMRTELRHEANWIISEGDRSLHGRLKIVEQTCDQVTVVQIHDDANAGSGPNKPLLRIYKHLTKTPVNHLWAAVKTDAIGDNTTHVDLGEAPSGYFGFDVRLVDGNMIIEIDGDEKANMDVSYWTFPSYWKAGVYLQDEGEATAYFDELYEGDGTQVNHSPSVGITSPTNGESFVPGDDITINVDAFDTDGTITLVEFFQGNVKLGEDATEPYSFTWNSVPAGDYTLTAVATDNEGATTKSLGVDISLGIQYDLTTSVTGEGIITLNPSGGSYAENTVVSLTATPSAGYQFDGWAGDLSGRQNPISITMDADKNVTATFVPIYTLTTSVNGEGSISINPSGGAYKEGTVITLTAIPDSGNQFESWSVDASGTESQITVTMNSNKSVTANFGIALSIDDAFSKNGLSVFPNPLSTKATIEYALSAPSHVALNVFDINGRKVDELINGVQSQGNHTIDWTPKKDLQDGLYFVKLRIGNETKSLKILLDR
ncbi:Ig-like domain-containing protein [Ekhidna sp.]|uniref:InlB B-repeat-containing protein n=1 Tax=Ekhidna sp. TaxID=2608089 RepID=UPI0035199DC4